MATLNDSLVSSSARRLMMRRRPDLTARRHRYQGRSYWVVKEPVGLNYFRFQDEEFAILQMIDGHTSLDEIKERFEAEFPPQKITVEELQQFVGTLHRSGLIVADVPGQGHQLRKRRDERRSRELRSTLSNVLAIRFKGIDPERLLNWLEPRFGWVFSLPAFLCVMALALAALTLVTVEFDVFQSKLPAFHQFFTVKNAIWLGVAMAVSKVLHEFGHGLSCKHFGGECHEMGVMILVLTPCLYCNVSDSWMLPNKWHRAAIGAAGMYVEVFLASVATFVWWFSEPGMLNHLALSTMFVCSVSTIVFNGNPLLRYDGYYILSDITEIPNLRQKATDILNRKMGHWCLGLEPPEDPFLPQRNQWFFALYSVAAAAYRWLVVLGIMWFLYKVWEPYHLEIIGQVIALAAVWGLAIQPLWRLGKFFWVPGRLYQVKRARFYTTLALAIAALAAVVLVPLPYRIYCPLEVEPRDPELVYVRVPGKLEAAHVKPGEHVQPGQTLAELSNYDIDLSIAQLVGERNEYAAQLDTLRRASYKDLAAQHQIPAIEEKLQVATEQLARREEDRRRLTLTAAGSGTVLPPPDKPLPPDARERLAGWSGHPMSEKNLGCWLQAGELFCQIGDPRQLEAHIVVDQADIDFVTAGQRVQICLDAHPGRIFEGTISDIADSELKTGPRRLTNKAGGELPTKTDESGREVPLSTSYLARVPLPDDDDGLLHIGLRGRAKIHAPPRTLGQRLWRYLSQTFNFEL